MNVQTISTKDALEKTAHRLFAERGFDGVSIAEIAGELKITKQALLHHFGNKEALYGQVLENLSTRFDGIVRSHRKGDKPAREQFLAIMRELFQHMIDEKHDAQLIMRELLDNKPRIAQKQKWYLRPFLETLAELISEFEGNENVTKPEALARVFQILGAANYYAISDPTLKKMFGEKTYHDIEKVFLSELERLFLPQ